MHLSSLTLSILLIAILVVPSTKAALTWNIQTVDEYACSSGYGTVYPIVVDSKNVPHIAYTSVGDPWCAVYASWNGSGWGKQILAQDSFVQCLTLDSKDNPHIIFFNRQVGQFQYASWTGTSWSIQNTGIKAGYYFALAFDTAGTAHMVYTSDYSEDGYTVNYAILSGTKWDSCYVDMSEGSSGVSFALDANDTPYILYSPTSYADNNLTVGIRAITTKLATYQNNTWSIQTLSLPPPTGTIGDIVIDSKGDLHFVCTQHHYVSEEDKTILSTILYASWDGAGWQTQAVASDVELLSIGQLVLDKNDIPRFTYLTPAADGETKSYYACWTGKFWGVETIPTGNGESTSGNLAFDSNGNPHMSSRGSSGMRYTSPLLYATAIGTMDNASNEGTDQSQKTIDDYVPIILGATLCIMTSVLLIFGIMKRKIKNPYNLVKS